MSYIVKVRIDDEPELATFVIRQMSGTEEPGSWGDYNYRVFRHVGGQINTIAWGTLRHRFGDGPLTLLRKVCDAADL